MNCAIIVENRQLAGLQRIIDRHMKFLPGWDLKHHSPQWIRSGHDYNTYLTTRSFWEELIQYERVLIFQADSMILRSGIDEFMEYDFIGAPIYHIPFPAMNGGFSLRNPRAMLQCLDFREWSSVHGNEDISYCHILESINGNLPTKEIATKFSVESLFSLGSFGIHQIHSYLSPQQCNQILNQYDKIGTY